MPRKLSTKGFSYRNFDSGVMIFRDGMPYSIRTEDHDEDIAVEKMAVDYGVRLEHNAEKYPTLEIEPGVYELRVWINHEDLNNLDAAGVPLRDRLKQPTGPLRGPRYV